MKKVVSLFCSLWLLMLCFFPAAPARGEEAASSPAASEAPVMSEVPAESETSAVPEAPAAPEAPEKLVLPADELFSDPSADASIISAFNPGAAGTADPLEASDSPLAFPRVIDRITDPAVYPDFAFDGEADLLELWLPAIRDQDCTIFRYQDQIWLLDCGDERAQQEIVPLMQYLGITRVDRLINTHPHHDHLNGLYAIDAACPVRELCVGFPEDATQHMTAAMEYCKGNGIPVSTFEDESVLSMGDGFVTFLAWMKSDDLDTMNNRSAQFMVTYGDCSMLFMADLEYQGQLHLLEALEPADLKADLLRYPHHGKSKMIDALFEAINPSLSIITNTNRIVELRESTQFLAYQHAAVVYTHNPTRIIHLQTDGRHWLCEFIPYSTTFVDEDK